MIDEKVMAGHSPVKIVRPVVTELSDVSGGAGVYVVFDPLREVDNGRAIYVGQSKCLGRRMRAHSVWASTVGNHLNEYIAARGGADGMLVYFFAQDEFDGLIGLTGDQGLRSIESTFIAALKPVINTRVYSKHTASVSVKIGIDESGLYAAIYGAAIHSSMFIGDIFSRKSKN